MSEITDLQAENAKLRAALAVAVQWIEGGIGEPRDLTPLEPYLTQRHSEASEAKLKQISEQELEALGWEEMPAYWSCCEWRHKNGLYLQYYSSDNSYAVYEKLSGVHCIGGGFSLSEAFCRATENLTALLKALG